MNNIKVQSNESIFPCLSLHHIDGLAFIGINFHKKINSNQLDDIILC